MLEFQVSPLREIQLDMAFPLVRAVAPVNMDRWIAFAREKLRDGQILGLFSSDTSLLGLAVWRCEDCLRHGRTLHADTLVTFELDRLAPARQALCEALERRADDLGCAALMVAMQADGYTERSSAKLAKWSSMGFKSDMVTFAKTLHAPIERATS